MTAKHTPGPWKTRKGFFSDAVEIYKPKHLKKPFIPTEIAVIRVEGPEGEANARLIVTAPDLLAALKQCRLALEPYDDVKPRDWKTDRENLAFAHQAACAAIAKATGGAA